MLQEYYLYTEALNSEYAVYNTHNISTIRSGSSLILPTFDELKKLRQQDHHWSFTVSLKCLGGYL